MNHQQNLYYNPNNVVMGNKFHSSTIRHSHPIKKKIVYGLLIAVGFFCIVGGFRFTKNVLQGLPDVSKIKDMVFSQATVITDRNGEELYKLFEENRQYVDYTGISKNMVNAIVAIEDQRYWENNGLDPIGILRAAINNVFHLGNVQGASTIPQQLVRNLLLTNDRSISRKLKEIILTSRLQGVLENQIHQEQGDLNAAQLRTAMKEKTLELYLNYISFGNNAFGVEAASKTYFGKSAIDLTVLESAILASLPKGPSLYDPYKNPEALIGEFAITDVYGNPVAFSGDIKQGIINKMTSILQSADLSNQKSNNAFIKFLQGIGTFSLNVSGINVKVAYTNGRKDLVLTRMYEDSYITQDELKVAFIQGMSYEFHTNAFPITAPHFVQRVIQEAEKTIDKDTLAKGGFVIKTTLDAATQKLAEDAITANASVLQQNGANNSAMIYLDSRSGDVLAYVGSINYFDEAIKGQNDMVQRPRQSGSSIKPFIYALGFQNLPLAIDSPIYDIPFKIGPDSPSNADGKFEGAIPLKYALGHSRNIAAAKMILALGGEEAAKPFLHKLGLSGVKDNVQYGYTLALGAAEVTMLEEANAYMHLSNPTGPAVIDPILEIRSRDGSLVYQKTVQKQPQVIPTGVAYLIWKVLSYSANEIPGRIGKFTVSGLTYAVKSGTSDAKTSKGNRPRDGRLAAYTPSKVVLFRGGNADGTPMNINAYGGTIHANPLKTFFKGLLKNGSITNETMKAVDTTSVQISKVSGKLATASTPADRVVNTMMYSKGPGLAQDDGATTIQYDAACGGLPSSLTPPQDIKNGYLITPTTFMPDGMDLKDITDRFKAGSMLSGQAGTGISASGNVTYNYSNVFVEAPIQACAGRELKVDPTINVQITQPNGGDIGRTFSLSFTAQGSKNLRKVSVMIDDTFITSFSYLGQTKLLNKTETVQIGTGIKNGTHTLQIIAFDYAGYSNSAQTPISLTTKQDTQAPVLLENQIKVVKQDDGTYQVTLVFSDDSGVGSGKITSNGNVIKEFQGSTVTFPMATLVPVSLTVADTNGNKLEKSIDLSTYIQQ